MAVPVDCVAIARPAVVPASPTAVSVIAKVVRLPSGAIRHSAWRSVEIAHSLVAAGGALWMLAAEPDRASRTLWRIDGDGARTEFALSAAAVELVAAGPALALAVVHDEDTEVTLRPHRVPLADLGQ